MSAKLPTPVAAAVPDRSLAPAPDPQRESASAPQPQAEAGEPALSPMPDAAAWLIERLQRILLLSLLSLLLLAAGAVSGRTAAPGGIPPPGRAGDARLTVRAPAA